VGQMPISLYGKIPSWGMSIIYGSGHAENEFSCVKSHPKDNSATLNIIQYRIHLGKKDSAVARLRSSTQFS